MQQYGVQLFLNKMYVASSTFTILPSRKLFKGLFLKFFYCMGPKLPLYSINIITDAFHYVVEIEIPQPDYQLTHFVTFVFIRIVS